MAHTVQLDIKQVKDGFAIGYLYTSNRCVKFTIQEFEYENLMRDGFFIRDGKKEDCAGIINTTHEFKEVIPGN